jgi:hypothetical protein
MSQRKRKKRDCPSPLYVTHSECLVCSTELRVDIKTIKEALVGKDLLGGGMVQELSDLKRQFATVIEGHITDKADTKAKDALKHEDIVKWKIAAIAGGFSIAGIVLGALLAKFL